MPDYDISFDELRIDFRSTSDMLKASYWGDGRTDEGHRRAFSNSLCVGAYLGDEQVGFGRAITDATYFAYLADLIIWPEHRGKGIGKRLVRALLDHPDLSSVIHWSLSTIDAHGLYAQFGFVASEDGRYMRLDRQGLTDNI